MKLNWGTYISLGMIGFIVFIVIMGIRMGNSKAELETRDYYNKGINYDQQYQRELNTSQLKTRPLISMNEARQIVKIDFPEETKTESALVVFYRPDDKKSDFEKEIPITKSISSYEINPGKLKRGLWYIRLYWSSEGKDYYFEEKIVFP